MPENTLNPGDIAVLGWNATDDTVTFATLVDIPAGTVIKITDKGWDQTTQAFTTLSTGDGVVTWTTSEAISAGHVFGLFLGGSDEPTTLTNVTTGADLSGAIATSGFTVRDPMNLAGDSIFIYQGADDNPFFIFGMNNSAGTVDEHGWNTSIGATLRDSMIPDGNGSQNALTPGVDAIGLPGGGSQQDNVQYTGDTTTADRDTWLARIADPANWSGDNTGGLATSVVTDSGSAVDLTPPSAPPVLGNIDGDSSTFIEGSSPVRLDAGANATVTDVDSADFAGGNVTVSIAANRVISEDVLGIQHQGTSAGQIGLSGSSVTYGGTVIGTVSGGTGSDDLVVQFNASATVAAVQALVRNLTYANSNDTDPIDAARLVRITIHDGDGGTSSPADVTVNVTGVNDAPVIMATGNDPTYTENGSAVDLFSGVSISAVETGQTITGMTLAVSNLADGSNEILRIDGTDIALLNGSSGTTAGNGISYAISLIGGTATLTLSSAAGISPSTAQAVVDGMSYRNASDAPSPATRVITLTSLTDSGGTANGGADTRVVSIATSVSVVAVNDAPIITTSGGTVSFIEDAGNVAIDTGLTLSDLDNATLSSARVAITGNFQPGADMLVFVNSGSTMGNITASYNAGTGLLTLTSAGAMATLAQWQAALRSVTYSNTSDDPSIANRTISFVVNDGQDDSAAATRIVSVTAVNDAPQITAPVSIGVTEDTSSAITGIHFSDVDAGSANVTVTLSVGSGMLSATSGGGVTVGGTASALTLTGSIADINSFIAGSNLSFTTAANATADVALTVNINDGGNTGSGGAGNASETITLQVAAVNDAPTITAPGSIAITEDVPGALTSISFTDVDAGSAAVTVTFSVPSGTLSATSGSGVSVGGTASALTLTGSLADINAFIAASGIGFTTASNATANVTLTVTIDDGGNSGSGGAQTDTTSVTLTVTAVNDAPVNSVPTAQSVDQDSALVFNSVNGNLISISDVDAGSNSVKVTLTATHGLLTLGSTTGLTFSVGSGGNDETMTFAGSLADINNALNGLVFSPTGGYNGPAILQITTDDLGNSGSGGAQTDTDTIGITVSSLNPHVTDVSASTADGIYKVGDTITITAIFSEMVTVDTTGGIPTLLLETGGVDRLATYVSGSGGNTLTFIYTVQPGDLSADLDYQSTAALSLNGAAIRSGTAKDAVLTLPAPGGTHSLAGNKAIVIDGIVPTVYSVSVPADGTYVAGQHLDFTVNLSEAVTVDTSGGTPRIAVTVSAGGTVHANYVSGSGTTALTFQLTVANGWRDANGISLGSSIDANGGTLRDAAGNHLTTTLNGVGSTAGVLIDAVAPAVSDISLVGDALTNAASVTFLVTFTKAVSGVDKADFTLTTGGDVHATLGLVSTNDSRTYEVTVENVSGQGTLRLDLKASDTGIADSAGNAIAGGFTDGPAYAIDTVAPDAPALPVLDAGSDSGVLGDGRTNDATPTITGTAEAGSTVRLYGTDGTTELGSATADAVTGAWTITSTTLADGTHNLTVKATDAAGNESGASAALELVIDTAAPDTPALPVLDDSSDSGVLGDGRTNDATPTISGTAEAGSTVRLYDTDGTTELGSATADAVTGAWSITSTTLADGQHSLIVKATDAAGNESGASAALELVIDTAAPDAPALPALDASSDSGVLGDGRTNDATPTITGTAEAGSTVRLYGTDGTTELGSATADAVTGAWAITSTTLADGQHSLIVKATDAAGNESGASAALELVIDTAAPDAPALPALDASSDSGVLGDGRTNDATPTITGTAEAGSTVRLYGTDGTTELGSATADAVTGAWAITSTTLADGQHSLIVKATDAAGNESGASAALELVIDTAAPDAPALPALDDSSDSGVLGDGRTNDATPTITGIAEAGSTVRLYGTDGTTELGSATADAVTGAWAITSTTLADGQHSLIVKATDAAGNESGASAALDLVIDTAAPDTPALPVLDAGSDSGIPGDGITNVSTPTITGTAEAGSAVTLYGTDGVTVLGSTTADAATGAWSVTSTTLSDGPHSLTITATDAAGNVSQPSTPLELIIDTAEPGTPALPALDAGSDSGVPGDGITNVSTPTITGTAEAGSAVTLYDTDGVTVLGSTTADAATGAWSITSITLSDGPHSLTITATDAAGNVSPTSPALGLVIDTAAPDAPALPVLDASSDSGARDDDITNVNTPTITGTAEPGSIITLYATDGVTVLGSTDADPTTGAWTITSTTLADGQHSLTVKAVDAAGNESGASAALELVIDTTAPEAPALPVLDAGSDSGVPGDGRTNDATPTITGTAEPGSTIMLYGTDGTTELGTATADAVTGAWSITSTLLTDGAHSLTVTATDAAGNTSASSAPLGLTVDTAPPLTPGLSARVDGPEWLLTVSGLEAGATWQYRVGEDGGWQSGTGTTFSLPLGNYAQGLIQVRQIDAAGNASAPGRNPEALTPVVPPAPSPIDAPDYDGNGDGIPDAQQPHVMSLAWRQSPDGATHYMTLVVHDGARLAAIDALALDASGFPDGLALPFGALTFAATDLPESGVANFSLFLDPAAPVNGYWKQIDGQWVNIADTIDTQGERVRIDFTVEDGGSFDADGERGSIVVYPGAPGWFDGDPDDLDADQIPDQLELTVGTAPGAKDNDVFARSDLFVMQVYRDALGREADGDGLLYWQSLLDAGALSRQTLVQTIVDSDESAQSVGTAVRLGLALDGRIPDAAELADWRAALQQGVDTAERTDALVTAHYGPVSDTAFVDALYQDALGRAADAEGLGYWQTQLSSGQSRGDVTLDILASAEFDVRQGDTAQIALLYTALLGRPADADGLAYWSAALGQGLDLAGMTLSIIASTEYHDRFMPAQGDLL